LSYATVHAYHVYQAAVDQMGRMTAVMKERNARLEQIKPKWWEWHKVWAKNALVAAYQAEAARGWSWAS
jgi:hypothetical protein